MEIESVPWCCCCCSPSLQQLIPVTYSCPLIHASQHAWGETKKTCETCTSYHRPLTQIYSHLMNIKCTLKLTLGVPLVSNSPDLHGFHDDMFKLILHLLITCKITFLGEGVGWFSTIFNSNSFVYCLNILECYTRALFGCVLSLLTRAQTQPVSQKVSKSNKTSYLTWHRIYLLLFTLRPM